MDLSDMAWKACKFLTSFELTGMVFGGQEFAPATFKFMKKAATGELTQEEINDGISYIANLFPEKRLKEIWGNVGQALKDPGNMTKLIAEVIKALIDTIACMHKYFKTLPKDYLKYEDVKEGNPEKRDEKLQQLDKDFQKSKSVVPSTDSDLLTQQAEQQLNNAKVREIMVHMNKALEIKKTDKDAKVTLDEDGIVITSSSGAKKECFLYADIAQLACYQRTARKFDISKVQELMGGDFANEEFEKLNSDTDKIISDIEIVKKDVKSNVARILEEVDFGGVIRAGGVPRVQEILHFFDIGQKVFGQHKEALGNSEVEKGLQGAIKAEVIDKNRKEKGNSQITVQGRMPVQGKGSAAYIER